MSDSVRPNGQQPTRLLCPWDSLGKNTGVDCDFLLRLKHIPVQDIVHDFSWCLAGQAWVEPPLLDEGGRHLGACAGSAGQEVGSQRLHGQHDFIGQHGEGLRQA